MNERIRKLADQAGADFMRRINYNNLEGEEYEEDAGVIFESNESFEKFAELIVLECVSIVAKRKDQAIDDGWNVDEAMTMAEMDLEEHFGVE